MYKNATSAFQDCLNKILQEGQTVLVRGHEVKELRSQLVKIASPLERVYVLPKRNNNIFAMIAETIWVMAGRNDLEFLSYYLPRAIDFSDDNKIWRGAYGPRLRNWQGIDQFKEVATILNRDPQSRRAVMIIFDPAKDFVDSKDIPCNNWLHFMKRDNRLHMNAVIRSNDILWGFSGINTFEWSVLHEMMSYWTGSVVGDFSYFVSSLHLYSRHYKRAEEIVAAAKDKTLYDFGFAHTPFHTPLEMFDDALLHWFKWEEKIRGGKVVAPEELNEINDVFLRSCAQMVYIYNRHLANASFQEIANLVSALPSNDFRIAAIEYFTRDSDRPNLIQMSSSEVEYFQYYWGTSLSRDKTSYKTYSIQEVFDLLSTLHYKKTLVYKDSWKKHGEVVGVFANISRKYDRIESIIVDNAKATSDESLVDTIADLAVYAAKYLTYLAEHYPALFQEFITLYPPVESINAYSHNMDGFGFVAQILIKRHGSSSRWARVLEYAECFEMIQTNYKALDDLLINGDWRASDPRKCTLAADLSISAAHYLFLLSEREPNSFSRFVNFIQTL